MLEHACLENFPEMGYDLCGCTIMDVLMRELSYVHILLTLGARGRREGLQ